MRTIFGLTLLGTAIVLANGQACNLTSRVPRAYRALVRNFDSPPAAPASAPEACSAEKHISKVVDWVAEGDVGVCGNTYEFQASLDSCCGGRVLDNDRSITMNLDFSGATRNIAQAVFYLSTTPSNMRCCNRCTCWGDPHCSSFENSRLEAREKIKSFLVCDTALILAPGRCSNRLENSADAKARCLGTVPGYELNQGSCAWIADDEDNYSAALDGGPCVPIPSFRQSVSMFKRDYNDEENAQNGRVQTGVEVRGIVGERGINKQVEIHMRSRPARGGRESTTVLVLDVKHTCGYLRRDVGDATDDSEFVIPETNEPMLSVVNNPFYHIQRITNIQTSLLGAPIAVDMTWIFEDKFHGDSLQFNCKGATDAVGTLGDSLPEIRNLLESDTSTAASAGAYNYLSGSAAEAALAGASSASATSASTRPPKATIIDSKFYVSTVNPGGAEEDGFCFTSDFAEYREPHLYDGETSPLQDACKLYNNFDFSDRSALSQLASCRRILRRNNCYDFLRIDRDDIAFSNNSDELRWLRNFSRVLETCAKVYCASEAYIPPTGSVLECYTDFLDLGASVTMKEYFAKPDPEVNPMLAGAVDSTAPVLQEECEETYTLKYYTTEGLVASKDWVPGNPVVFDVSGEPTQVVLEINDCTGICATRPSVFVERAIFTTECTPADAASHLCVLRETNDGACGACVEGCADACATA